MEDRFWKLEDIVLSASEKDYFQQSYKKMRIAFHMLIFFCSLNSGCACFQTFFLEDDILAFICYQPEWMSFYTLWFVQALVMVFSIIVPIVCLDVSLMTLLTLTQIQFKLLNKEVENIFNDSVTFWGKNTEWRIRRVIRHHVFLLGYVLLKFYCHNCCNG